jgi:hypothetical protein
MLTLRQDGWRKVVAGLTTPEEVMNVTYEDKEVLSQPTVTETTGPALRKAEEPLRKKEEPAEAPAKRPAPPEKTISAPQPAAPQEKNLSPSMAVRKPKAEDTGATRRNYERADKDVRIRYRRLSDEHLRPADEWVPFGAKGEEQPEHTTTSRDISAAGVFFFADEKFDSGTMLGLKIELPDGERIIDCMARVERVEEIKKGTIYGVAVTYLDMSRLDRVRIDKFVKGENFDRYVRSR